MQTASSQYPNNINQQTRKIAVVAILLFALSGLISGFAVGAFVHPKAQTGTGTGTAPTNSGKTPVTQNTKTPASTTPENVHLNAPQITYFSYVQAANGSTNYTVSSLIVNNSNQPIQVSDVMCKLWLAKDADVDSILGADNYAIPKAIDTIQQPFKGEVTGAFNFISPAQQTQPCTPNGQKTNWNYTVSPSVNPGKYKLVVLADWKGKNFHWSWVTIRINKG